MLSVCKCAMFDSEFNVDKIYQKLSEGQERIHGNIHVQPNSEQISCKTKLWYIDKFWQKFSFFSSLTWQCWEGSCNRPAPWLPTYIKACKSFSFHLNTFMTYIYPRRLQMRDICHVVSITPDPSMQKGSISPQSPFRWGK